mmetsp:Transcript_62663/g.149485  ORF Transcript_62663/g.149485 Transcript_62663/m.149485 type:complete len:205 (-) Transcript_62663:123-737(-)
MARVVLLCAAVASMAGASRYSDAGVSGIAEEAANTAALPDCMEMAKQLYVGGHQAREFTEKSCKRADLVMKNITGGKRACYWTYFCADEPSLGETMNAAECWKAKTYAIGFCQDVNGKDCNDDEDDYGDKDVMDVTDYYGGTVKDFGEEEIPEDKDELLKPAPEEKPWERVCCKLCGTGRACGHSCISKRYECSKEVGCACDPL